MKTKNGKHIVIGVAVIVLVAIVFSIAGFGNLASDSLGSTPPTTSVPETSTPPPTTSCVDEITREVRAYSMRELAKAFLEEVYPEHPDFPKNTAGMAVVSFIQKRGVTWAQDLLIEVRVRKCN